MLIKNYLLFLVFILLLPSIIYTQCPDQITAVINPVSNDGTNCTFNVDVDVTSNGNSSLEIWVEIDNNGTITQHDSDGSCDITGLRGTVSLNFGDYTASCNATVTVHYIGYSSPNCGGGTCKNFIAPLGTLPIELIDFKPQLTNDDQVLLKWSTYSEDNNDYFEVQHSIDGINFKPIHNEPGNGTSFTTNEYEYLHKQPVIGSNYYRLKQFDLDGGFQLFDIIVIELDTKAKNYKVYPTYVNDLLTIEAPSMQTQDLTISIFDSIGKMVKTDKIRIGNNSMYLDVSRLQEGLYFVQISNSANTLNLLSEQIFKVNF